MTELNEPIVQKTVHDGVAVLRLSYPPVNALAAALRDELFRELGDVIADADVQAIVITGAHGRFVAGADIRAFNSRPSGVPLADLQKMMEDSRKPVVAAIEGYALGGGLELALAASFRVASETAKLGFPEVDLGLLPGGGGTQRGTRLAGPVAALDLMLSGRHISASEALTLGLVDAVVPAVNLVEEAAAFAKRAFHAGGPFPKAIERTERLAVPDADLFENVRRKNARRWEGTVAPHRLVDCIESATRLAPEDGLMFERRAFVECRSHPAHLAQVHLFFAQRAAAKLVFQPAVKPVPIATAAIVGAGTMGTGIAMALANTDIRVRILDLNSDALEAGMARIRQTYASSVKRGSRSQEEAERALALIEPVNRYDALAQSDLVIEAAFEDMGVKREIFAELDRVVRPGAILATNTSTLDIDEIAAATGRPADVVGMHFFSPANVMKLLEVVKGSASSDQTIASSMSFGRAIGKIPILAGNGEGFIANNIQHRYSLETDLMLEEGATPWQVDRALQSFGFPMGVYLMRDLAGLDVGWRIRKGRKQSGVDSSTYGGTVADRICEMGRFGQKTGAGYYRYENGVGRPDPEIEALIALVSAERKVARRSFDDEEIVARVLCAMVNQGAWLLDRGIARRAGDIDVAFVYGYGFPRHRGGPMYWAQFRGLSETLADVQRFQTLNQHLWEPAPSLVRAAATGSWDTK